MATITGYTSARMDVIENSAIVDGAVVGDNLFLEPKGFATDPGTYPKIDAGDLRGPQGDTGPAGEVTTADMNAAIAVAHAAGAIDNAQLASNAVDTAELVDGAVTTAKIAVNAVDTNELADGAVTQPKVAANAITQAALAADSVGNSQLADDSVAAAQIQANAVGSSEIATGAVGNSELATDAVDGAKIANDSIDSEHYVDNSIDNAHLANDSVDSDQLVDGSIDEVHLSNSLVSELSVAAGNGWAGSLYYWRAGNIVHFSYSDIISGVTSGSIATLPSGYRPARTQNFVGMNYISGDAVVVTVYTTGSVDPEGNPSTIVVTGSFEAA